MFENSPENKKATADDTHTKPQIVLVDSRYLFDVFEYAVSAE